MHNRFETIAIAAVLALTVVACRFFDSGSGNGADAVPAANSTSGSSATSSDVLKGPGPDPKEDIVQASKRFLDLKSFSANMESTGGNERVRMELYYVAPDRYHIKQSGPAEGMETIVIGKETYMKAGGQWAKLPTDLGESIPTLRDAFSEEGLKSLTDVKFDGEESVDGEPALVYSYRNAAVKEGVPFRSKIWVRKDTGLPAKIVVDYEKGELKQMTIRYDTESPVKIDPPAMKK